MDEICTLLISNTATHVQNNHKHTYTKTNTNQANKHIFLHIPQTILHGRAALFGAHDRRALHGRPRGSPAVRGAAERPPGAGGLAGPPRRALQAAARPPHDEDYRGGLIRKDKD